MTVLDGVFAGVFVAVVAWCVWFFIRFIDDLEDHFRRLGFCKDLKGALKAGQPTWAEICDIAELRNVGKQVAFQEVKKVLRDVIVGREEGNDVKPHRKLLEGYLAEYRVEEPFEGLPSNTRISLERLRQDLGGEASALRSLTSHFRELLQIHDAINRRQRFYTFGGFLVGVAGFLFGVVIWFFPTIGQTAEPAAFKISSVAGLRGGVVCINGFVYSQGSDEESSPWYGVYKPIESEAIGLASAGGGEGSRSGIPLPCSTKP
ncbi:hypothetical protein AB7M33_003869 [Pseudomonas sp. Y3 TE3536]